MECLQLHCQDGTLQLQEMKTELEVLSVFAARQLHYYLEIRKENSYLKVKMQQMHDRRQRSPPKLPKGKKKRMKNKELNARRTITSKLKVRESYMPRD